MGPADNVDEHRLFEKICLEGFQAGLSWLTILLKRPRFREVFADFDYRAVAEFGSDDVERLLDDAGIIRHRGKIEATINNAQRAVELAEVEGSLVDWVWEWAVTTPDREPDGGIPGQDRTIRCTRQGPEAARLEVLRPDNCLCVYAIRGVQQRS